MTAAYLACLALGYLIGSLSVSILISKYIFHQDVRTLGSGNAGAANAARTLGAGVGLLTLLGDFLKGVISMLLGSCLGGATGLAIAGAACMIGHCFPIYFGFKGGKGILVSVAVLMTVEWIPACILLGIFIIVVALTRYVSLGSCIAAVCYPVTILVYSLITGDPCVWINVILSALIAVLILFMHRGNLVRLKNHTEKKLGQKA